MYLALQGSSKEQIPAQVPYYRRVLVLPQMPVTSWWLRSHPALLARRIQLHGNTGSSERVLSRGVSRLAQIPMSCVGSDRAAAR